MNEEQRKEVLSDEHLFIGDLRKQERRTSQARLYTQQNKLVSGTFADQVVTSIDEMLEKAYELGKEAGKTL